MFFGFTVGQITAHTDWITYDGKKKLTSKVQNQLGKPVMNYALDLKVSAPTLWMGTGRDSAVGISIFA